MYFLKAHAKVKFIEGNKIELLNDVILILDDNTQIIAPKGFICDGASIPRFFYRVIGHPFQTKFINAAIIHDRLYATHEYSKEYTDILFLKLLKLSRVSLWKRQCMYYAVKWFGRSAWKH